MVLQIYNFLPHILHFRHFFYVKTTFLFKTATFLPQKYIK